MTMVALLTLMMGKSWWETLLDILDKLLRG